MRRWRFFVSAVVAGLLATGLVGAGAAGTAPGTTFVNWPQYLYSPDHSSANAAATTITPATFTILNFPVDDIESAVDELTARGAAGGVGPQAERALAGGEQVAARLAPAIPASTGGKVQGARVQLIWITERTLPAGSLNQAMSGPPCRLIPFGSVKS